MYQLIDKKDRYSLLLEAMILQKSIRTNKKIEVRQKFLTSIHKAISMKIVLIFVAIALFVQKLFLEQAAYSDLDT
ncbi:hypothetical protein CUM97_05825 [Enterococcus mundtii]|nr:hypothetical protein CUM97_05825 [Enterococcus mundtii]